MAIPTISLVTTSLTRAEGQGPFEYIIERIGDATLASTVKYAVTAGSGSAVASASDFKGGAFPTGTVSFAVGQTKQTLTINVVDDSTPEGAEAFNLTLSSPTNGTLGTSKAVGTINNDDSTIGLSGASPSATEGSNLTFTVTRQGDATAAASVSWLVSSSGASPAVPTDFFGGVMPSGTLTWAAGDAASKTITVRTVEDTMQESNETFTVKLTAVTNAPLGTSTAIGTIKDNDGPPVITIQSSSAEAFEDSSTPMTFTVTRSGSTLGSSSVQFALSSSGSAPASVADFGGSWPSGVITFAPGQATAKITVTPTDDSLFESNETFTVSLANPVDATLGTTITTKGSIRNDDRGPTTPLMALTTQTNTQAEGDSGVVSYTFTATRYADFDQPSTVAFSVKGSGLSPASGADFETGALPTGTAVFAAGAATATFSVVVKSDALVEPDEAFTAMLKTADGVTMASAEAFITNDDLLAPLQALTQAFTNLLRVDPDDVGAASLTLPDGSKMTNPLYAQAKAMAQLADQVSTGKMTKTQADAQMRHMADGTTSVATLAYQFFTGATPREAGYDFLIRSSANANDLNDPYYLRFSNENRYINFAVNLGKLGEGAADFLAEYGGASLATTLARAYTIIFGVIPDAAKIDAILNGPVVFGGATRARAEYFAVYGGDGLNGIGTKAAMVGWLLAEAVKADIGVYAGANIRFLDALADGVASFNIDLMETYGASPAPDDVALVGVAPDLAFA